MDLLWSYKTWEDGAKLSRSKKLIPINKLWLTHIPNLMGKKFGRVRPTPNNVLTHLISTSGWRFEKRSVIEKLYTLIERNIIYLKIIFKFLIF